MLNKLKELAAQTASMVTGGGQQSENWYRDILDASRTGIFEWDIARGQFYGTERTFEILGLKEPPGWIDQRFVLACIARSEQERLYSLRESLETESGQRKIDTWCVDEHGNKTYVQVAGRLERDDQGGYARVVGSISDVSEHKKLELRLRHEALHDYLTGLPNRTLLVDRIQHVLTRLRRDSDLGAALLFMDIDNFKAINDNLGHGFGDDVLVAIGERLTDIVRATDTIARIGSDEFVVLLEDPTTSRVADKFAERLLKRMHEPLSVQSKSVNMSFSVGLVMINDPEVSVEALLGDADIAMYAAKDNGRGQVVPFDATMRIQAAKRLDIETALRQAMEKNELFLAYQPIFRLEDSPRPTGVEALLRWSKSGRRDIAPGELLAVAEENGMIEDIGYWVIRTATKQLSTWREEGFPEDFYININLSSRHFDDDRIVTYLLDHIDSKGLRRQSIRIEVVESAVIRNPERALGVIERLRSEGIYVSIDDFGTGFSSLSYLHRFPFYSLKIDRCFVMDVLENQASQNIISAIVLMAKKLNIRVVAEGVETEDQLKFLKEAGCEMVQGFLLAKPTISPESFFTRGSSRLPVDAEPVAAG